MVAHPLIATIAPVLSKVSLTQMGCRASAYGIQLHHLFNLDILGSLKAGRGAVTSRKPRAPGHGASLQRR